jgi:hypothetical protein
VSVAAELPSRHLRKAENVLGRFTDDFLRAVKEHVLADPWKGFADQFRDINASYDAVSNLIDSYLSGSPIDVFASASPMERIPAKPPFVAGH